MNFKERGVTVGDLLIFLIILISTISIVKIVNKENKSTSNYNLPKLIIIETDKKFKT